MKTDGERPKSVLSVRASGGGDPEWKGDRPPINARTPVRQVTPLRDGARVVVVGGGPAGSFFSHHVLREARRISRNIEVLIVEKHGTTSPDPGCLQSKGCNFCAGGISPRLNEILGAHGLVVPNEIIQGRIDHIWIQGQWKNFRLRVPDGMEMYSVFRGSLPGRRGGGAPGFDAFLLSQAVKEGARITHGEVQSLEYSASGLPRMSLAGTAGEKSTLEADFVAVAAGINARCGMEHHDDALFASLRRLNPSFVPGRSRRTLIFELDLGAEYLDHNMHREVYFIEYGSKNLALEHIALVPKGRFLTVALMGECIDKASLPADSHRIVHEFLALPQIERILPGISEAPVACTCIPRMTVTTATSPFGDRFAIIGDAVGSRLNKDGLFSAHVTASRLAHTVLHEGIDREALARGYGETVRWLAADNRYGRIVFAASRVAFMRPLVSRITYQAYATEFKVRDESNRPLSRVLWKIASGTADYREVLREMCSYRVLRSVLIGALVTLRNVAVEAALGLKWGEYGRYPTMVLKEKRSVVKQSLESSLGMELEVSPDFERMYVIKIRGSGEEILQELAQFGQPGAKILSLRFLKVRRIQGEPNRVGSVVEYRAPLPGLETELRLSRRVGSETLLYELEERLVENGRLILNIAPTRDGNLKLTIYAAFDYKKGNGLAGRMLWGAARLLFPAFLHDVVWNHALCTIKEEVEWKHNHGPAGGSRVPPSPGSAG
jgi:flavin-dependent dehydrogenase